MYPRSFQDSDGDGVGDLRGVQQRLDHLEWLGIDAIWLSPVFPSPMADFGYDVADYTDVDPLFGSLDDLDSLVGDAHRRGMRVLLDFVANHTSDRHPWFLDARSSRSAAHRDWYIWRDPAPDGGPPNNWRSIFGGSAWELDAATGQYYYHAFLKKQPELDWRQPEVRSAMADVLRFWLRRGIDGFRLDVIWLLAKGPEVDPGRVFDVTEARLADDQPQVHRIVAEMRAVADEFDDRLLIGEIYLPLEKLVVYYGDDGTGIHLPFNFQLLQLEWRAPVIRDAVRAYEQLLPAGAWPNWVLGNHDNPRVATRVGAEQARVAAMLLLTLRGTPTIYYGDEICMSDVEIPAADQRDPQGLRGGRSRDPARTPMRWDAGPGAGFTSGAPWLPLGRDLDDINVAAQRDDPASMLSLHRALLQLRRGERALYAGAWHDLGTACSSLAYLRAEGERRFLVALNLAAEPSELPAETAGLRGNIVVSTLGPSHEACLDGREALGPHEGIVVLVD